MSQATKTNNSSISQLRYYDNQGLLPFLKRIPKGNRIFDEDAMIKQHETNVIRKMRETEECLKNPSKITRLEKELDK
ncbi:MULTISPECIES: hypothetical protein [unclassified Exiguobacterium]|uniref:hypothetical protein n=1 Tax=unclassified Exiguobacterium TaxID=2644629 RepID=UPI002100C809|nr:MULTISPECIES: hypothetical protein [unclassified Exiguobacterium]